MEIHTLWPLSQGEIEGRKEQFIDRCFDDAPWESVAPIPWRDLAEKILSGGYPEVLRRSDSRRRRAWYESYLSSVLSRDIRDLSNIEGYRELPDLLRLLAARTGGLLNDSDLARDSRMSLSTLKRYRSLLEAVFLYVPLPAWYRNETKRLIQSPKIYLNDTGLAAYMHDINAARLTRDRTLAGGLLENFAVMELRKQRAWSETMPSLYHFRTAAGKEVDVVLEAPDGRIAGVEIKSRGDVSSSDFSGLRELAAISGERFTRGIILYGGEKTIHFEKAMLATPISALWRLGTR
jgi:predicted AAA+ superfamily ATPase